MTDHAHDPDHGETTERLVPMMVERSHGWEACLVNLTEAQQEMVDADPYDPPINDPDLEIVDSCGHRHRDPDSKASNRCYQRLVRSTDAHERT